MRSPETPRQTPNQRAENKSAKPKTPLHEKVRAASSVVMITGALVAGEGYFLPQINNAVNHALNRLGVSFSENETTNTTVPADEKVKKDAETMQLVGYPLWLGGAVAGTLIADRIELSRRRKEQKTQRSSQTKSRR